MDILFKVTNQLLERVDDNFIVENSENYLFAKFEFSEDWEGTEKVAMFRKNRKTIAVLLDEDACEVPWEVIKSGILYVSVVGGDLITSSVVEIKIAPSGDVIGESPKPPTPSVYKDINEKIKTLSGGATNQMLIKNSDDDFDYTWKDSGGVIDYTVAINKPMINGIELDGDKSTTDLGLFDSDYNNLINTPDLSIYSTKVETGIALSEKQDVLKNTRNIKSINNVSLLGSGNLTLKDLGIKEIVALAQLVGDENHQIITSKNREYWNSKQDELVSGTNIKTVNGQSVLGSGDIKIDLSEAILKRITDLETEVEALKAKIE